MGASTAVIITLVVLGLIVVAYYNGFISRRNRAEQAFSTIDVMLKKRCDLVPNLVAAVQGYVRHEAGTLTRIAELRSRAGDAKASPESRVAADNEMRQLLGGLMVQVENYPDLQANVNFLDLQASLHALEEQLSAARRIYNSAVTSFNTATELFPGNLVAGIFGFRRQPLLEIPPEDRKVPDVGALLRR